MPSLKGGNFIHNYSKLCIRHIGRELILFKYISVLLLLEERRCFPRFCLGDGSCETTQLESGRVLNLSTLLCLQVHKVNCRPHPHRPTFPGPRNEIFHPPRLLATRVRINEDHLVGEHNRLVKYT